MTVAHAIAAAIAMAAVRGDHFERGKEVFSKPQTSAPPAAAGTVRRRVARNTYTWHKYRLKLMRPKKVESFDESRH
jgi:hypothetical protein